MGLSDVSSSTFFGRRLRQTFLFAFVVAGQPACLSRDYDNLGENQHQNNLKWPDVKVDDDGAAE